MQKKGTTRQGVRINQFVLGGFGIIVFLNLVTTITSYIAKSISSASFEKVAFTYQVKAELRELERKLVDAETGQRGFVITNANRYLQPYEQALKDLDEIFAKLKILLVDTPEQLAQLTVVEELAGQKLAELAETITLKRRGEEEALLNLILSDLGKNVMDDIREKLTAMDEVQERLLAERQQRTAQIEMLSAWIDWGTFVLISVVSISVSLIIIRLLVRGLSDSLQKATNVAKSVAEGDLTVVVEGEGDDEIGKLMTVLGQMTDRLTQLIGKVKRSGIEVASSATQIAASGKQLEVTMREQAATTQETTTSARNIAVTARELATTMDEVSTFSKTTTDAAADSQAGLGQMEETIRQLMEATNAIATRLGAISEKANNINTVVTTITKVADQTNLLSLNAAIEAEKAGEYGVGFAVVAREIRRLADQTAVATLEIESMVKEMQSSVSTGVMEMDKFSVEVTQSVESIAQVSNRVGQIIQQVQNLSPRFEAVNQGMDSQVQSAQQISEAMTQLNEVSLQTNNSFEDINAAIAQLNAAAQNLQQEMRRFKVQERYNDFDTRYEGEPRGNGRGLNAPMDALPWEESSTLRRSKFAGRDGE